MKHRAPDRVTDRNKASFVLTPSYHTRASIVLLHGTAGKEDITIPP
jgi:hypothetical protein